jgi:hypothetical protein
VDVGKGDFPGGDACLHAGIAFMLIGWHFEASPNPQNNVHSLTCISLSYFFSTLQMERIFAKT